MIPRVLAILIVMLVLILGGSACGSSEQEFYAATSQSADSPFVPLQATVDAAQGSRVSDPLTDSNVATTSGLQPAQSGDLDAVLSTTVDSLISAINIRRALDGWRPLIHQGALTEIAKDRALDMSVRGYLDHQDPETAEIHAETMLAERGFYGNVAELVYSASVPLDRLNEIAIDDWFDDPDTRAVLLSPGFRFIGIGIMGDGTTWKIVQILAEAGP